MIDLTPNRTEICLELLGEQLLLIIEAESNVTRQNVQDAIRLVEEIQCFGFPQLSPKDESDSLEDIELIGVVLRNINRARRWGF